MKMLRGWRMAIPPAAVPLALSMFVAMAGPGGVVEVGDSGEPAATGAVSAGLSVGESFGDGEGGDGGGAALDGELDVSGDTATLDGADGDGGADDGGVSVAEDDGKACEEALSDRAKARERLEGHVVDEDMPDGGVNGNQNALDHQCGGAFADEPEQTAEEPADPVGTDPGKSEQAPGGPEADGKATGQGQANADARGNGAEGAPGKNKP
jgi:hypothetical protein